MSFDYAAFVALARRLIDNYGRDITLFQASTTLIDAADKTRGYDESAAPSAPTRGAFVYPSGYLSLGISKDRTSLLAETSAIVLVAPVAAFDVEKVSKVLDGGGTYLVETVETLRPGDLPVLHYIGLKK